MSVARIVLVALVNRSGEVLLRLHDEQSATRPNRWSLPGGAAAAAETPQQAAARLVKEQTGLRVGSLRLAWRGRLPDLPAEAYLYAGGTDATEADISSDPVPGALARRGSFMVTFVPGAQVQSGRSFTPASGYVIGDFLTSPTYRDLSAPFNVDDVA